jgi:hypothetical protein
MLRFALGLPLSEPSFQHLNGFRGAEYFTKNCMKAIYMWGWTKDKKKMTAVVIRISIGHIHHPALTCLGSPSPAYR